jgi:2-dehydro-3-deoxyphosphogluconate aldolase/(4S)-4-hydroxy-2-oxoglutarate aldolase
MPWASLMPTGGVDPTAESITKWVNAGVAAIGMGSRLITAEAVKAGNWQAIEEKVRATLAFVQAARKRKK